jgi:hypothetical protein
MSHEEKDPHIEDEEEDEEEDEDYDEEDEDDDEDEGGIKSSLVFVNMLDTILSRHLEYSQDNNTLSLAEILLLIKQSLDSQNSILSELLRLKISKYGASGASGQSGSSSQATSSQVSHRSSSSRQETPEERAIRKQKEASRSK